jgi:hypothetical protein
LRKSGQRYQSSPMLAWVRQVEERKKSVGRPSNVYLINPKLRGRAA